MYKNDVGHVFNLEYDTDYYIQASATIEDKRTEKSFSIINNILIKSSTKYLLLYKYLIKYITDVVYIYYNTSSTSPEILARTWPVLSFPTSSRRTIFCRHAKRVPKQRTLC
jgi:hypothetical protein